MGVDFLGHSDDGIDRFDGEGNDKQADVMKAVDLHELSFSFLKLVQPPKQLINSKEMHLTTSHRMVSNIQTTSRTC